MNAPLTKEQFSLLASKQASYVSSPVPVAKPGLFASLARGLRWVVEFPRRQAVLDELGRLSDRELSDIGLTRAELKQVFVRPR